VERKLTDFRQRLFREGGREERARHNRESMRRIEGYRGKRG
jgi:hypothetical protein